MAGILDEFLLLFRPTVKGAGFQVLNKQMKSTYDGLFSLKNLFSTFIGYDVYSGLKQFGMSLVNATREMGAMKSRFYAITASQEKANEQLQWAFKLAERTAMPMKSIADSYSIFYAATAKGLGDSGAQQVFQDWTEVSRVLHMSEYQFERVTYALREMASKGVVYSQDLRMQIGTHVPNAIGLAQKAVNDLGITGSDWFEKFQKQSKGNQKMINQFLLLFSKYAKEQFADPKALAEAMKQPDAQILRLRNQWDKLRYAIADAGFSEDLAKNLTRLNDTLDKIVEHADKFYKILKLIAQIFLLITGIKLFARMYKWLRGVGRMFRRFGKGSKSGLKFFDKIARRFNVVKGSFLKTKNIVGRAFKLFFNKGLTAKIGLKAISLIVRQLIKFGLKGLLNFIPLIGQIIFVVWTVIDVVKLLWDLLDLFFPKVTTWLKLLWQEIVDFFTHLGTSIKMWWDKWFGWLPFGHGKQDNSINFPQGVRPEDEAWRKVQASMPFAPYGNPNAFGGNNFNTPINIVNNVNANGLSASELEDVLNRTNKTNTDRTIQGIRDSFNKPSR